MISEVGPDRVAGAFLGPLRTAALVAVLTGAAASVAFTLVAGHRNPSHFLIVLFVIWVLSPFMALVFATFISKSWSVLARGALYGVMLFLSLASLAIYGCVALGPPRAKTAFVFVVVPPSSWLLMAMVIPAAGLVARRFSHRRGGSWIFWFAGKTCLYLEQQPDCSLSWFYLLSHFRSPCCGAFQPAGTVRKINLIKARRRFASRDAGAFIFAQLSLRLCEKEG